MSRRVQLLKWTLPRFPASVRAKFPIISPPLPAVKLLFDFFPLILFFVAFKAANIFVATGVAIAATLAQIGWVLARGRRVSNLQWTSFAIIVIFGGATLVLHDETFIKWK